MTQNPIYFDLKENSNLKAKTTKTAGKSYFLIPLGEGENKFFTFKSTTYRREEHHCSVFKEFSSSDPTLSPIHYSAVYTDSTGNKIIIHGFYDEFRNYILSQVRFEGSKNTESLIPAEKLALKNLVESEAKPHLIPLFQNLLASQKKATEKKETALADLEQESLKGMSSETYICKLKETITALDNSNSLDFFPCYSIRNFLQKHLNFQEKSILLNKKSVVKAKSKLSKSEIEDSLLKDILSILPVVSESKSTKKVTLSLDKLSEKELYHKLDECPPDSLDKMLEITKELDNLNKKRMQNLVQACIDGNLKNLKNFYHQSDLMCMELLLSTAVYHNQSEVFEYLFKRNKLKDLLSYISPFESAFPITIATVTGGHKSYLGLAYFRKNFDFFSLLLNTYHVEPNEQNILGVPLLYQIIIIGTDNNYLKAMLQAKANPNIRPQNNFQVISVSDEKTEWHTPKMKDALTAICKDTPLLAAVNTQNTEALQLLLEYKADPNANIPDDSPLYAAVRLKDTDAVKLLLDYKANANTQVLNDTPLQAAARQGSTAIVQLLLKYKANSHFFDEKGFTPFSEVFYVKGRPVNKTMAEAFLEAGHTVDERQGPNQTTALYYQCQIGNLDGVKVLLELGANPCAPHKVQRLLTATLDKVTPLSLAANKGFTSIVEELLKHATPSKEIKRALLISQSLTSTEVLRQAFYQTSNKEGINAFKEKNLDLAELLYREALEFTQHASESHSINYNLGVCLLEKSKEEEALKIFISLQEDPQTSPSLLQKVKNKIEKINDEKNTINISI